MSTYGGGFGLGSTYRITPSVGQTRTFNVAQPVRYNPPNPTFAAKVGTLTDDFVTSDTAKWTFAPNASVSGGQLTLTTSTTYQGARSVGTYDLTASSAHVQVVTHPAAGSGSINVFFALEANGPDNAIRLATENGRLYFQYRVGGSSSSPVGGTDVAFDPVAHAWWRLVESGGTLSWQTAPDGSTWTTRASISTGALALNLTAVRVHLNTGHYAAETSPGPAVFDNFNTAAVSVDTVTPDLAGTTPSLFAPTLTSAVTVTPNVASSAAAGLAPTLSSTVTITPDPATSTASTFAPTVTQISTVSPDLAGSAPSLYAPTLAAGSVTATPNAAGSAPTLFAPTLTGSAAVTPDVAGTTPTLHQPTIATSATVTPAVAGSTPSLHAPTVSSTATVTPDVATVAPSTYAPTVTPGAVTVTPGVAGTTPTAHAPIVTAEGGPQTVAPNLAGAAPSVHNPTVSSSATVAPDLAVATAETFAPAVAGTVTVTPDGTGLIATAYGPVVVPTITLGPDTAGGTPETFPPTLTVGEPSEDRDITLHVGAGRSRGLAIGPGRSTVLTLTSSPPRRLVGAGQSRTLTATPTE